MTDNIFKPDNTENSCNKKPNHHIVCSVCSCEHNCKDTGNCALDKVQIGTHEANPTVCQCVDCQSFVLAKDAEAK